MTWDEFHRQSEQLAIQAHLALREHRLADATKLYKEAAELEQKAYEIIDVNKTRTRGITAVSAAALWYKAREYARAEQLAYATLSDSLIPDFAQNDLRNIVQAVWVEKVKQEAGLVQFFPGQILVSVKGGEVVTGGAPLDLIVDKVHAIQSMLYRTMEYFRNEPLRKAGRPSKELQESCRPWLFQSAPGSYQFSVAVQRPIQPDFFKQDIEPEQVANQFLQIVDASLCDDPAHLERLVPDENYRNTFLKLTRNLAPCKSGKAFERIELRASGETKPVAIDIDARENINRQLKAKVDTQNTGTDIAEELHGTLRAVHLDEDWLDVLVDSESVHIIGLKDAVDDLIGPMVNRAVVVRVVKKKNKNASIYF